jgi:hypothetical protein
MYRLLSISVVVLSVECHLCIFNVLTDSGIYCSYTGILNK